MVGIEATPQMAAGIYARMAANLAVVRGHLGRPLTLADKLLLGHLDDAQTQELEPGSSQLVLRPDRVVFQDVLGQTGLLQFMQTRRAAPMLSSAKPMSAISGASPTTSPGSSTRSDDPRTASKPAERGSAASR